MVCGTDTQKPSKKPSRNPVETHSEGAAGPATNGATGDSSGHRNADVVVAWRELVALCQGDEKKATAVWRLQERFAAVTKLKRPDPATEAGRAKLRRDWWPNLILVLADADGASAAAEAAMLEAVESMVQREKPLHVVSPRSIVNVTAGVLAGWRRGEERPRTLPARPRGLAGIDAYLERRGQKHGS